ncbi:MAG: hypothetical protein FWB96_08180 [Defluviitaleaceae bacterium]|nr:hypothetical protein [Defluviitaleaceae bacterium]MCL2224928.1 hypothetical protein [Defluviitaleaceae bacterium]MCL2262510.1 hypothetical protein [Defluviitaleaceae bacterium]
MDNERVSRKQQNKQIERKKKAERRTGNLVLFFLFAAVIFGVGYLIWDGIDRRTVMTFNGESIPTGEFRVFHMMLGAPPQDEEMRELAFDGLARTLAVLDRAEQHGIEVSEEEREFFMEDAAGMREWFNMQVPNSMGPVSVARIADFLSVGGVFSVDWLDPGPLFSLLMEEYKGDFVPSQSEIDEWLDELMEDILNASMDMSVKYIVNDSWDDMWEAWEAHNAGDATFDDLITLFHQPQPEDEDLDSPASLGEFAMAFNAWEFWQDIMQLEEGEVSTVFMLEEGFVMVQMYSREINEETLEEIMQNVTEGFITESRENAFFELVDQWVAEADISRNERTLRRI